MNTERGNQRQFKLPRRSLIAILWSALLLAGCTVGGVDVEQEQASGLAGELLDGGSFGQTFTLQYDGLYRIDLYTATYARENTHPVLLHIYRAPCEGDDQEDRALVDLELPADQISNSGPTVITFPPVGGTAGQPLCLVIESPGSVSGDAITVYRQEQDIYPGGEMFVDGQPTGGDLAFIAYTQETFTLADIWNDFYSRARQDTPFFAFYCSLLGVVILALLVAIFWPGRAGPLPPERPQEGTTETPGRRGDPG